MLNIKLKRFDVKTDINLRKIKIRFLINKKYMLLDY